MEGWIKVHRNITKWEWYDDSKMVHLFFHLLLSANHKDGNWRGQEVKRGQFITGLHKLNAATGISVRSLRTCLERLKNTKEVTIKTTSKNSVITIVNYDFYQGSEFSDKQTTNERQANDKQTTTNKNDKNDKKEKNENKNIPTYEDFLAHALSKIPNLDRQAVKLKFDSWIENDWKDGNNNKVTNWKSKLTNTVNYLPKIEAKKPLKIKIPI